MDASSYDWVERQFYRIKGGDCNKLVMLLQSGQHMGVDHVYHMSDTSKMSLPPTILASDEVTRYLDLIQDTLKDGWTVHATKEGRLYYCK